MKKFIILFIILLLSLSVKAKITDFLKKPTFLKTNVCENVYCPVPPASVTTEFECVNYYLRNWRTSTYTNMYGVIHKSAELKIKYKRFAKLLKKEDLRLGTPVSILLIRKLEDLGNKSKWELLIKFPNKRVSERKVIQNFIFYKGKYWLLKGGLIPVDYDNL